jgi:hypothetical protein
MFCKVKVMNASNFSIVMASVMEVLVWLAGAGS